MLYNNEITFALQITAYAAGMFYILLSVSFNAEILCLAILELKLSAEVSMNNI